MALKNITIKDMISWDVSNWSKALHFWEKNCAINFNNAKVLEIGSSQGGLSLWAASKGANVICSDLTDPEESAKSFHQQFEYSGTISYQPIDATNIPYENHFDVIMFKSVLGGVGRDNHPKRQQKMIDEIHKTLKPDGILLFAENLKASWLHQFFRKRFVRWGTQWRYITIAEMQDYCRNKFELVYDTAGFLGAFGRSENQRYLLSILDTSLINSITSKNSKYILFGTAKKK